MVVSGKRVDFNIDKPLQKSPRVLTQTSVEDTAKGYLDRTTDLIKFLIIQYIHPQNYVPEPHLIGANNFGVYSQEKLLEIDYPKH